MATKAHLEGNKRHLDKLDRVVFYLPKGEKEKVRTYAESKGLSLNVYLQQLVSADMNQCP